MENNQKNNPFLHKREGKSVYQLKVVFEAFYSGSKTMKEVDRETGIMRENICWYCRKLRCNGQLYAIGKKVCSITRHTATIYTTNPDLVTTDAQLKFF